MTHPPDIEARVRDALRAEAAGVALDPGSLSSIRARGRAARRRRRAAVAGTGVVALVAVALAVPALDRPERHDDVTTMTSPSSTDAAPTTEGLDTLTDDDPAPAADTALWPDPAGELYTDPVEAASAFVEALLDIEDPPLSEFRRGGADSGEIDVERWSEDGGAVSRIGSTLQLRRLDGEHWFVTAATSDDVQIETPPPQDEVSTPVAVTGQGRGWERAITVELLTRSGTAERLRSVGTTAGEFDAALEPFEASLEIDVPAPTVAIVMARDDPAEGMAIPSFAAVPVRIGAAGGGP